MRRVLHIVCLVAASAFLAVGPGAQVAAGDDGPTHSTRQDRPARSVLRPAELAETAADGSSGKTVIIVLSGIGSDAADGTFGPLIAALGADPGYEVHRFGADPTYPYDTHGSIHDNADQLIAQIRALAKTHPKIEIVSHSMGGAVVDDAFRRGLSADDKVTTYIALAAPHNGSTEAQMAGPLLRLSGLIGTSSELRAITGAVAQDVGTAAVRDLAEVRHGPPPERVTRLDLRMATDAIVTGPDAWTPGVTSRTLLPGTIGAIDGHGGVTTDPRAIALVTSTLATGQVPPLDWRGAILDFAARAVSAMIDQHALVLYGALGDGLFCGAAALAMYRRRRRLPFLLIA
jgi:hypothetical protein